jgi:transposase InsO family protein
MVYQFMKANQDRYTIKKMTEFFGVSRSAYYKWMRYGVSNRRKIADAELLFFIRLIIAKHHRRYGSPRVRKELLYTYGKRVSLKKVARLMRENGLNAIKKRKFMPTTNSKHAFPACENILNRKFHAEQSGQKWVSDITYLRTNNIWIYLTVILDLFDRKVIGWALSTDMESSHTTIAALHMAVKNRTPKDGLIFHSDRGVQYCAQSFRDTLHERCPNVSQSMSRKGNCWDNACAESFFKTLKRELDTLDGKHSMVEVRQSVFMFIEAYYNRIRLHSTLGYVAPNEFNFVT